MKRERDRDYDSYFLYFFDYYDLGTHNLQVSLTPVAKLAISRLPMAQVMKYKRYQLPRNCLDLLIDQPTVMKKIIYLVEFEVYMYLWYTFLAVR